MKDDKKKLMVLGGLVAVMLAVGAFTFMGGGSSPAPVVEPASTSTTVTKVAADGTLSGNPVASKDGAAVEEDVPKNPLYAADLPQRDPFVTTMPGANDRGGFAQPPTSAPVRPSRRPTRSNYEIPPYMPITGQLPSAGGAVTISQTGPDPNQFSYTVSGVITGGNKPAAVFTDSSGNQRLVPVGGSLDGDSKVVAIDRGNVTIEHRGKKQRLSLGGNPK